jgi:integrase
MAYYQRCENNKGLPPNLYYWKGWYKYRHPKTNTYHGMGSDRRKAVSAAQQLNSLLMIGQDLVAQVMSSESLFNNFLDTFIDEILPERKLSKKTLATYHQQLKHIRKHLGDYAIDKLQVKDIAEFISQFPPRSSNAYRGLLADIFKYAIARGLCSSNPAIATIPKRHTKQRIRMTLEGYQAIYSRAPRWLQNAMDLALQTLQRREDIAKMRFSDIKDQMLFVIQEKTEKHGECAHLKIKIEAPLQAIIQRCRDNIPSPYLVHRLPDKITAQSLRSPDKQHLTQCLPDYITKQFRKSREACGYYKDIPVEQRPGFHEIRALGSKLYKDAGIDPQTLLGHTDKKMTQHYLDGHGIQWTQTKAGLSIGIG